MNKFPPAITAQLAQLNEQQRQEVIKQLMAMSPQGIQQLEMKLEQEQQPQQGQQEQQGQMQQGPPQMQQAPAAPQAPPMSPGQQMSRAALGGAPAEGQPQMKMGGYMRTPMYRYGGKAYFVDGGSQPIDSSLYGEIPDIGVDPKMLMMSGIDPQEYALAKARHTEQLAQLPQASMVPQAMNAQAMVSQAMAPQEQQGMNAHNFIVQQQTGNEMANIKRQYESHTQSHGDPAVREMQLKLNHALGINLVPDGIQGKKTNAAIAQFNSLQQSNAINGPDLKEVVIHAQAPDFLKLQRQQSNNILQNSAPISNFSNTHASTPMSNAVVTSLGNQQQNAPSNIYPSAPTSISPSGPINNLDNIFDANEGVIARMNLKNAVVSDAISAGYNNLKGNENKFSYNATNHLIALEGRTGTDKSTLVFDPEKQKVIVRQPNGTYRSLSKDEAENMRKDDSLKHQINSIITK